ncbi:hypothetical protein CVT26_009615, partial [Gymnopilus dilepis]
MDSIFGRKKVRPRQSSLTSQDLNERSIPYDKLSTPQRSPIPVGTLNQGIKGISAPNTNPALTAAGTELNKFTMQRSRFDRERLYEQHRQDPSTMSISTADSSTAYEDSLNTLSSSSFKPHVHDQQIARIRRSEASSPGSQQTDFNQYPSLPSLSTRRPNSSATLANRSDLNRGSKYAASLASSEAGSHHSHLSQFYHRHHASESFHFPRPENDEEIEAMFENVKLTRDLGDIPDLSIDQKWQMVYNDECIRWKEDKQREEQSKRQSETGQPATMIPETPQWYIRKFLDKTITPKQASSLLVCLRSKEVKWFQEFISLRGASVLAQTLQHISRKGPSRQETDIKLEYEVVKCLRSIFNNTPAANEALTHPSLVTQIASSLNSPNLPTRKSILELLAALTYWNNGQVHHLVVAALEALSLANNESGGSYDYWFKSMEQTLSGRGKMGSLVGASEEVKRTGGVDSSLNDYAVANLVLINGILAFVDDLDLRLHHRSQMESAGLRRILELCSSFGVSDVDKHVRQLQATFEEDEKKLRERLDQEILQDLTNPQDVYNAIYSKTQGTRARSYFLSMMQHLLLIREEGQAMVHYYQLLDSIVTDVVLDKKLAGAEQRMGHSVERIIAQFNEADRYQAAEDEAAEARALAVRLKLEKEALEEEISQGQDGLVGKLKDHIAALEEKLSVSRETTSRLHRQLETQKASYEEKINQLEAQILELFRMLKEVGKGVDSILDGGAMDRKALVATLERNFQRQKTISILEGKEGLNHKRRRVTPGTSAPPEDLDATPGKSGLKKVGPDTTVARKPFQAQTATDKPLDETGRVSQFMDADEAHAIEQYSPQMGSLSSSRSIRASPRRVERPPLGRNNSRSNYLLTPKTDDIAFSDAVDLSRSSSPVNDDESDYGRSTRSGFTNQTEDTIITSISSDSSPDKSHILAQASPTGQLSTHLLSRSKSVSLRNGDTDSVPSIIAAQEELALADTLLLSSTPPPPPPPP